MDRNNEFFRKSILGGCAYITHRSSNVYGRYPNIIDYRGGGRKSLVIIPEEVEAKGWKMMAMELCEMSGGVDKTKEKDRWGRGTESSNSNWAQKLHAMEFYLKLLSHMQTI